MTAGGKSAKRAWPRASFLLIVALAAFSTVVAAGTAGPILREDFAALTTDPGNEQAFQQLLSKLPKLRLKLRSSIHNFYVVEGDLILNEQQVRANISAARSGSEAAAGHRGELLVLTDGGKAVFWPKGQRELTYVIDRATFPSAAAYDMVAENFQKAAMAWQDACPTCGVTFTHQTAFDGDPSKSSPTFVITWTPDDPGFIAASFFPNDPAFKRQVVVTPSYLTTTFDKVGVFRHEIGHILGYRHEQNVGVPGCVVEDGDWAPLTPYNPHSVMHYFCGGHGTMSLELTASDLDGHRNLYK